MSGLDVDKAVGTLCAEVARLNEANQKLQPLLLNMVSVMEELNRQIVLTNQRLTELEVKNAGGLQ